MPTGNEILAIESDGWVLRVKPPQNPENAGVLLLLHGWTGDETVMWIFARNLDHNTWIVAPRGPVSADSGGYGWLPHRSGGIWHSMPDFQQVTGQVIEAYPRWLAQAGVPPETANRPFNLMGFSQGAAMSFALAAHYPERVQRVAALAGFLPEPGRNASLANFAGKKIYIAHGTQDDTVPVTMAQEAVRNLQGAGAQVTYCESDSGHKLSLDCLRGLQAFLT